MNSNVLASEKIAVIGTLDPATVTNEAFTDVIDLSEWIQVMAVALLGNMADANDVVMKAYVCDSAGNNAKAIKTKTLTAAAGNDNSQIVIGVRSEDLHAQATYNRYIKFGLANAGGTGGPAGVAVLGVDAKYGPASDNKLSTCSILNALD